MQVWPLVLRELYRSEMMKLKYLGTGGGGGIPELFCSCPVCLNARARGGKELRRRSLAIIDDELCIDLPCDARDSFIAHGVDYPKIAHILITHAHYDHFMAENLLTRPQGAGRVELYISRGSGEDFQKRCEMLRALPTPEGLAPINVPNVHLVKAFESFRAGAFELTALESSHAKALETLNYLISRGDKSILWLHDSGVLTGNTRELLREKRPRLSLVSMDCALPTGAAASAEHMDLNACAETADFLRSLGCVGKDTRLVLSHISHNTKYAHEQLLKAAADAGFRPACDGEEFNL